MIKYTTEPCHSCKFGEKVNIITFGSPPGGHLICRFPLPPVMPLAYKVETRKVVDGSKCLVWESRE